MVKPATIRGLTSSLDEGGKFEVKVPVANVDTGMSNRNDRLNSLFFNSAINPTIAISGKFELAAFEIADHPFPAPHI